MLSGKMPTTAALSPASDVANASQCSTGRLNFHLPANAFALRRLGQAVSACAALLLAACGSSEVERGRRLFVGEMPLQAHVAGHDLALPSDASRCSNCHSFERASSAAAPAASSNQTIGGGLTTTRLLELNRRRGGPPSKFDEKSLCRLLRTGVDPALIIVSRTMPRYDLSDADCYSLWMYLSKSR